MRRDEAEVDEEGKRVAHEADLRDRQEAPPPPQSPRDAALRGLLLLRLGAEQPLALLERSARLLLPVGAPVREASREHRS